MSYDLQSMKAPRVTGGLLQLLTLLVESPLTGPWLARALTRSSGIPRLRQALLDTTLAQCHPLLACSDPAWQARSEPVQPPEVPAQPVCCETAADFTNAYLDNRTTPVEVAERISAWIREHDGDLHAFIAHEASDLHAQAQASAERYHLGRPLGPLDGVPVAVKDEVDAFPYPTTVGTRFLGKAPAGQDAEAVRRLRQQGALIIGKTNMTEIGLGVTGFNPHYGSARNPYQLERMAGGSSSGSAAAVAAGLCPIAVGADGGGSIRIPAAFCGLVGLKPTYGRVSEHGAFPLCWSVAHLGPIGATVRDALIAYYTMAGPDPQDRNTLCQPPVFLNEQEHAVHGLRLGIFRPWFEDADPEVVQVCLALLDQLQAAGIELVEIELPELDLASLAHTVTIVSEMLTSQHPYLGEHRSQYAWDTRLNLGLASHLRSQDYVQALRVRHRFHAALEGVLGEVDAVVTPTTALTAPLVPAGAMGESNLPQLDRIMRFIKPANLTGHPAITFPAGYDSKGLPIGMHLMGRAWEEKLLFNIASKAESLVTRRPPPHRARLLH